MTDKTTVEVKLDEAPDAPIYILTPTLNAMKDVNRMAGGYAGAFRRLQEFDVDAMAAVIVAGTGVRGQPAKDLVDAVYMADTAKLVPVLVRFVNICAAGGRDPDAAKTEDGAAAGKN